jgi:hypothetical protein
LADLFDGAAQGGELLTTGPVAGKQNQATDQWVLEALSVLFAEFGACNVNDQRFMEMHDLLPG